MLRVLVVVLRGNAIVAACCFSRQDEIALINLGGVAADPLGSAVISECPIGLLPSRLLAERPVCNKAAASWLIRS